MNIQKFTIHVLLKPGLENFEHYFTSEWDECNCAVVWTFFGFGVRATKIWFVHWINSLTMTKLLSLHINKQTNARPQIESVVLQLFSRRLTLSPMLGEENEERKEVQPWASLFFVLQLLSFFTFYLDFQVRVCLIVFLWAKGLKTTVSVSITYTRNTPGPQLPWTCPLPVFIEEKSMTSQLRLMTSEYGQWEIKKDC